MSILDSPHRLHDDANGTKPTPIQHLSGRVLELDARTEAHETRIVTLEHRIPHRGIERAMLAALVVGVSWLLVIAHRIAEAVAK